MENSITKNSIAKAANILNWNKYILSLIGLWPESTRFYWFITWIIYYNYYLFMNYILLCQYLNYLTIILRISLGTLIYTHNSVWFYLLYKHNRTIKLLFKKIKDDYNQYTKASNDEVQAILYYNYLAKRLIKILLIFPILATFLYYFKPLLIRYFSFRKS